MNKWREKNEIKLFLDVQNLKEFITYTIRNVEESPLGRIKMKPDWNKNSRKRTQEIVTKYELICDWFSYYLNMFKR